MPKRYVKPRSHHPSNRKYAEWNAKRIKAAAAKKKRKERRANRPYVIPPGDAVEVRRPGETEWRPYVTKTRTEHRSPYLIADGYWHFRIDGWEVRVKPGEEPPAP
jgi:hypothetical protein